LTGVGAGGFFFTGLIGFEVFGARGLGVPVAALGDGFGGTFEVAEGAAGGGLGSGFFNVDGFAAVGIAPPVLGGAGFLAAGKVAVTDGFFVTGAGVLTFFAGPIAFAVF
jgi:hypothetical protein